eukprot:CAMPEP_0113671368 /NCGR_PEP_ID=MMETSP0038_2-20120614/5667_1 /TAXON_ID=2898 /ORGANISM="Cryptomonas paramecium" /LENGTH=123 /DNA_ID=CAMNT_0000587515 /DNA_START=343 /DNA_END=711 /DNA_ORIENTATION=- /assembly_acc=CAM_ASM_000170
MRKTFDLLPLRWMAFTFGFFAAVSCVLLISAVRNTSSKRDLDNQRSTFGLGATATALLCSCLLLATIISPPSEVPSPTSAARVAAASASSHFFPDLATTNPQGVAAHHHHHPRVLARPPHARP